MGYCQNDVILKGKIMPLAIVVFIILAVVLGPFITLWMLNTLFPVLAIPYTPATWLAALFLNGLFSSFSKTSK